MYLLTLSAAALLPPCAVLFVTSGGCESTKQCQQIIRIRSKFLTWSEVLHDLGDVGDPVVPVVGLRQPGPVM